MKSFVAFFVAIALMAIATLASARVARNQDHESGDPRYAEFRALAHQMMQHNSALVHNLSIKSLPGCITMESCKICGYYCGPGWCSDEYIAETDCVAEGIWGIPAISGGENCVDSCCRWHDNCCGSGNDRASCNTGIVSCLDSNDCGGLCSDAVWAAMKIVSHFCCGSECPGYSADGHGNFVPMSLASRSVCHKKSGLKLQFSADGNTVQVFHKDSKEICGEAHDVKLDQATNRISFGGVSVLDNKKRGLAKLHESCETNNVLPKNAHLKAWFFPNTGEVLIRDAQDKNAEYHTFVPCQ